MRAKPIRLRNKPRYNSLWSCDRRWPAPWLNLNVHWSKLDGPGEVTPFADSGIAQSAASFSLPGIYVLRLTADDSLNEVADTVEVRVAAFCTIDNLRGRRPGGRATVTRPKWSPVKSGGC